MAAKSAISVTLVGVPCDEFSSHVRGAALAPQAIRKALHCNSSNMCVESVFDLLDCDNWHDHGDVAVTASDTAFAEIMTAIAELLQHQQRVLSLGGDHWITHPILHAFAQLYPKLNVLQVDAHPDLYDRFAGSHRSHACTFARVMEAKLVTRLVQVGIRTMSPHQQAQAERFGVEVITMQQWPLRNPLRFDGPLYVSLDLDGVDPAFAPGVSHQEPGGLTSREILSLIQGLAAPIVGADIVELNPTRDVGGMTARLAAKLTKELLGKMLRTPGG